MTTNLTSFDSTSYQRYVSKIRLLLNDIARVNQDLIRCEQDFAKNNFDDYRQHVANLFQAKSPFEYFTINRDYMGSYMQKVARLIEKHKSLFVELNERLMQESDSLTYILPETIQQAINNYRNSGVVQYISPTVWKDFVEKFKY